MPSLKDNQIQARVPLYQKWVVLELIDTFGRNQSDVVSRILGEWIQSREAWLAERGLSEKDFRRPRSVGDSEAVESADEETRASGPKGTVSPMKPREDKEPDEETEDHANGNGTEGA